MNLSGYHCEMILNPSDPRRFVLRTHDLTSKGKPGIRYVAKCKCGKGVSCLATRFVDTANGKFWIGNDTVTHAYDMTHGCAIIPCECGSHRYAWKVKGTYSATHKCNAKCLASKSGVCECSCGGHNHGASWG